MELITTPAGKYTEKGTEVIHRTSADLLKRPQADPVHLTQYDQTLPIIAIDLQSNGAQYSVPDGAAVNIRMEKPDKKHVYNPALGLSEDRSTVYIGVTSQMTAAYGDSRPTIEIVVNGGVAGTAPLLLIIDENQVPEDAYESTDEYLTIQQLAAEVTVAAKVIRDNIDQINNVYDNMDAIKAAPEEAKKAADSATFSESWAVGGTGTREGEDTNNAKYWAESITPGQFATAEQGKLANTAVQSVNGKTGKALTLVPSDIGAAAESYSFPSVWAGGLGGILNKEGQKVGLTIVDLNVPSSDSNAPYIFGSENPSDISGSPYSGGPFYGLRCVIFSGHLITVFVIEQYPTSGRIWGNTYDKNASDWLGWKQIGASSAMAVYDEMAAAYNKGVSGV